MKKLLLLFLPFLCINKIDAQYLSPVLNTLTVNTLPRGIFVPVGLLTWVKDGTSATDCSVGGGTVRVLCLYSDIGWVTFGSSTLQYGPTTGISTYGKNNPQTFATSWTYLLNPGVNKVSFWGALQDNTIGTGVEYGVGATAEFNGSGNGSSLEHAGLGAQCVMNGSGTLQNCYGVDAEVVMSGAGGGGNIGVASGLYIAVKLLGTASVSQGYGIFIDTPTKTSSRSFAANTALKIANQDGISGTNNSIQVGNGIVDLSASDSVLLGAAPQANSVAFLSLPTVPAAGTYIYCNNCTTAATCAGGGTGHMAVSNGTAWTCQ